MQLAQGHRIDADRFFEGKIGNHPPGVSLSPPQKMGPYPTFCGITYFRVRHFSRVRRRLQDGSNGELARESLDSDELAHPVP